MQQRMHKQRGMTGLGWLAVLLVIGCFAMVSFKLVPIYMEYYTVTSVLKSLEKEPEITKKSQKQVRSMVMRRLDVNSVYDLKHENISVIKQPDLLKVRISYTVREPIVGNIEIIITFDDKIELVSH